MRVAGGKDKTTNCAMSNRLYKKIKRLIAKTVQKVMQSQKNSPHPNRLYNYLCLVSFQSGLADSAYATSPPVIDHNTSYIVIYT